MIFNNVFSKESLRTHVNMPDFRDVKKSDKSLQNFSHFNITYRPLACLRHSPRSHGVRVPIALPSLPSCLPSPLTWTMQHPRPSFSPPPCLLACLCPGLPCSTRGPAGLRLLAHLPHSPAFAARLVFGKLLSPMYRDKGLGEGLPPLPLLGSFRKKELGT